VIRKKLGLIKSFVTVYSWQIGVNLVLDVLTIVFLYIRSPEQWEQQCKKLFVDQDQIDTCKDQANASKIGTIVTCAISLLFQICQ
jgi:hypothetical protein